MPRSWRTAPMVFCFQPCCPYCGEPRWAKVRTMDNCDGSRTKLCVCANPDCGEHFKIILEVPESGNSQEVVWNNEAINNH